MTDQLEDWEKEHFNRWLEGGREMRLKVILECLTREQVFSLITLFTPWDPETMGVPAPESSPDLVDPTDPA